jgi:hypothetical protein
MMHDYNVLSKYLDFCSALLAMMLFLHYKNSTFFAANIIYPQKLRKALQIWILNQSIP